jgi:hypothetical protein
VTVRNTGRIPTALEQAKRVKIVRPDLLTVEGPRGSAARAIGRGVEFHLNGLETRTVTVRVRVPAGTEAVMNARVTSTRGGVADREVRIAP